MNVEIGVECQMIFVVVFFICSCEIHFGAASRLRKGCEILKVAQINYVSRNQLHCTANLNFGLMCKKAKHCWAQIREQMSGPEIS